jgi:hypothetical protein
VAVVASSPPDQPDRTVPTDLPAVAAPAVAPDTAVGAPAEEPAGLPAEYGSTEALVTVRLLGPMQITTESGELRTGLRASARELLAYYLLHPDGATLEQAVVTGGSSHRPGPAAAPGGLLRRPNGSSHGPTPSRASVTIRPSHMAIPTDL